MSGQVQAWQVELGKCSRPPAPSPSLAAASRKEQRGRGRGSRGGAGSVDAPGWAQWCAGRAVMMELDCTQDPEMRTCAGTCRSI